MNFDNIFEYKIEIYKTEAHIEMHEMYEEPTRFKPRESTLAYMMTEDKTYSYQAYYSIFPHFTFRYKIHNYRIRNENILSLNRTECYSFLQDYAKLLIKHKIKPDSTEEKSRRFEGTPYETSLEAAEQAKRDALARFQKSQ